jgi:PAS domain-containing protein
VHPADVARDEQYLARVRSGDEADRTVEKRFVKRDGTELWVRCSTAPRSDASGQVRCLVAAFVDISEQRQKDRTLSQMNAFLTAIVENSPVAIYTAEIDGRINFWNPAAERIFGYRRDQVLGNRAPFVPPAKQAEAARLRERVVAARCSPASSSSA